jgi:hypothetical protein
MVSGISQANATNIALSSGDLRDACTRPTEAWISFCNGYVQALADFSDFTGQACIPAGTTRTEIVTLVENTTFERIASQEIRADSPAFLLVLGVLEATYPCD